MELGTHFFVTLVVVVFFNTLALLFLTHLIVFHIELKYKGLTTYEFLKLKENVTKESKIVIKVNQHLIKKELDDEMEGKRKILLEQAQVRRKLELLAQKEAEALKTEQADQLQQHLQDTNDKNNFADGIVLNDSFTTDRQKPVGKQHGHDDMDKE
jgi:hypothetical protein